MKEGEKKKKEERGAKVSSCLGREERSSGRGQGRKNESVKKRIRGRRRKEGRLWKKRDEKGHIRKKIEEKGEDD